MKPIAADVQVLYKQMQEFQNAVFPFLKPNFLDKIPSDERRWLQEMYDSHGDWMRKSWRLFYDKDYEPTQTVTNDLKNFLAGPQGADWGFGDFQVVKKTFERTGIKNGKKVAKKVTKFVRSDNGKKPPDWAFETWSGRKQPLSGKDLQAQKTREINNHPRS